MRKLRNKVFCAPVPLTPCLFSNQRACSRGIHISDYKHKVRLLIHNHTFKPLHNPSRLNGMRGRADSQAEIRLRELQIVKKRVRHVVIIMLPGMDEHMVDLLCSAQAIHLFYRLANGCHLHKIRSGSDDRQDFKWHNENSELKAIAPTFGIILLPSAPTKSHPVISDTSFLLSLSCCSAETATTKRQKYAVDPDPSPTDAGTPWPVGVQSD